MNEKMGDGDPETSLQISNSTNKPQKLYCFKYNHIYHQSRRETISGVHARKTITV